MLIVSILQFMFSILSVDKLVSNTLMEVKFEQGNNHVVVCERLVQLC